MGLLDNLNDAAIKKETLDNLPINPTQIIIDKILSPTEAIVSNNKVILAGTNNYLGLTFSPECISAGHQALEVEGTGTTGSRMANGSYRGHLCLETEIAELFKMNHAMVFSTGYSANLGTLVALLGKDDVALVDSEAHASLYDGCRLSGADVLRFKHNDPESLEKRLKRLGERAKSTLVIVEGLYSIRGDCAPLEEFIELKNRYGCYILVDEAHSLGLFGETGAGLAFERGVIDSTDFIVGTFSKSLGSIGGFCVSNHKEAGIFKYSSRPYIFTASPSPSVVATTRAALQLMKQGTHLRKKAWENANDLHGRLSAVGLNIGEVISPIVGASFSDDNLGYSFWSKLLELGVYTNLILPPAAPDGGSVIRCSVTAAHSRAQIGSIGDAFARVAESLGLGKAA